MKTKRGDELYCPSCGELIKKDAVVCPECGIENPENEQSLDDLTQPSVSSENTASNGSPRVNQASSTDSQKVVALLSWVGGLFIILFGLGLMASPSLAPTLFSPIVLLGGLAVLPPVRERRKHPISTIGWKKMVDERTVSGPDTPCSRCRNPIEDTGVERTRSKKYIILGVEVYTSSSEANNYHSHCLHGPEDSVVTPQSEVKNME